MSHRVTKSSQQPPANQSQLTVQCADGAIYSYLRGRYLVETPEERVRQTFVTVLVNEYGYRLEQLGEEIPVTGRGSGQARADIVVWRTVQDKQANRDIN